MAIVSYSYEYDKELRTFVFAPKAKMGLHGQPWPRFIVNNGGILDPIGVVSPEVNEAANEIADFMNHHHSCRMDSSSYGSILSAVSSRRFRMLMRNLVKVC